MAQPKGKTGNPHGRPKGTPNKVTTELKDWIKALIDKNRSKLENDLNKMEGRERWAVIEKLMNYTLPRQRDETVNLNISRLSEAELDQLLNRLMINEDVQNTIESE